MVNKPEVYRELGKMAAQCRNRKDELGAMHHLRHYKQCRDSESEEDKQKAEQFYNESYSAHRITPKPDYFK